MRDIRIEITDAGEVIYEQTRVKGCYADIHAGYIGEHNATRLQITLPESMTEADYHVLCFGGAAETFRSEDLQAENGVLTFTLPQTLTREKLLRLTVEAYRIEDDVPAMIWKSPMIGPLTFRPAISANTPVDGNLPDELLRTAEYADIVSKKHDHANAAVLDGLSDVDGGLAYNGTPLVGTHDHDDRYYTEAETDTLLSGYSAADHTHAALHAHANAAVLNDLRVVDGELYSGNVRVGNVPIVPYRYDLPMIADVSDGKLVYVRGAGAASPHEYFYAAVNDAEKSDAVLDALASGFEEREGGLACTIANLPKVGNAWYALTATASPNILRTVASGTGRSTGDETLYLRTTIKATVDCRLFLTLSADAWDYPTPTRSVQLSAGVEQEVDLEVPIPSGTRFWGIGIDNLDNEAGTITILPATKGLFISNEYGWQQLTGEGSSKFVRDVFFRNANNKKYLCVRYSEGYTVRYELSSSVSVPSVDTTQISFGGQSVIQLTYSQEEINARTAAAKSQAKAEILAALTAFALSDGELLVDTSVEGIEVVNGELMIDPKLVTMNEGMMEVYV